MTEPIVCTGNELAATLRGLRERGLFPWALDTVVVTNAGYRISYFYRVTEESQSVAGCPGNAGHAGPASVPSLPKNEDARSAVAGGETRAEKPKSALDAPACISIEERMAALRDRLQSTGKLRRSKYSMPPEYARKPYAD